jgi:hypothetical protein
MILMNTDAISPAARIALAAAPAVAAAAAARAELIARAEAAYYAPGLRTFAARDAAYWAVIDAG